MINKTNTHILGNQGEYYAKQYLLQKGYQILETNFSNAIGEIDIIAKQDDVIVFVEVKTRQTARFGLPREAINYYKQAKIRKVALGYLKFKRKVNAKVRFDCIEILGDTLTHIENCF